ncbi:hypothetical protein ACP70R_049225 [Stipagrostis hirtigluma subsp. patula]
MQSTPDFYMATKAGSLVRDSLHFAVNDHYLSAPNNSKILPSKSLHPQSDAHLIHFFITPASPRNHFTTSCRWRRHGSSWPCSGSSNSCQLFLRQHRRNNVWTTVGYLK